MSDDTPSPNGSNGRDGRGRFSAGNRGGPGNPHSQKTNRLRSALLAAITPDDLQAIVRKLIELAKGGDVAAAREVLDRSLGKPASTEVLQRVERLEAMLELQQLGTISGEADHES